MKIKNIKFKAKRLDNGEWIIGSFVVMKIPALSKTTIGIVAAGGATLHEVDPSTVCQFTGLTDCEGNEIWEGDILQDVDDYNIKYVVTFNEGTFLARKEGLYIGIPLHECVGSLGNDVITYAKVVGNKFDKEK